MHLIFDTVIDIVNPSDNICGLCVGGDMVILIFQARRFLQRPKVYNTEKLTTNVPAVSLILMIKKALKEILNNF